MQATVDQQELQKRKEKGMGSKNHAVLQYAIIAQIVLNYFSKYKAIPEISLDINGTEKIPDISFYKEIDVTPGEDIIRMTELPVGVVEVLSPTQSLNDLVMLAKLYFAAGIQSYWLVAPEVQSIYVYRSVTDFQVFTKNDLLKDDVLGIELELGKVF